MGFQRNNSLLQVVSRIHVVTLVILGSFAGVLLSQPASLHACTPPPEPWPPYLTPRDYVLYADYIFVGQVISTSQQAPPVGWIYSATVEISTTIKGVISGTHVSVGGFGPSSLCYTDIVAGPDSLIFFARGSSEAQVNIVYRRSGPRDAAGVFPATPGNLSQANSTLWVWLPLVKRL
jgi:hypothetical protein